MFDTTHSPEWSHRFDSLSQPLGIATEEHVEMIWNELQNILPGKLIKNETHTVYDGDQESYVWNDTCYNQSLFDVEPSVHI